MSIDIKEIKQLAQAVTTGWEGRHQWKTFPLGDPLNQWNLVADEPGPAKGQIATHIRRSDTAHFLAAMSPPAVLELIDSLEKAESELGFQKAVTDAARQNQADLLQRAERAEERMQNWQKDACTMIAGLVHSNGGHLSVSALSIVTAPQLNLERRVHPDGSIEFCTSENRTGE